MSLPFLTAAWRKLIMAQYEVPAAVLLPHLPPGLELDTREGRSFVSLVGFLFDRVRILGLPVPFHTQFEEVNLRFYVRRPMPDGTFRRGVVFLSEIVPKPAITLVARGLYGEAYSTAATRHFWLRPGTAATRKRWIWATRRQTRAHQSRLELLPATVDAGATAWQRSDFEVSYEWKHRHLWQRMGVRAGNELHPIAPGSMEEFITEHYWGYAPRRGGGTTEYAVHHRRWEVYPVRSYRIGCDFKGLYGPDFAALGERAPDHVLLAEGAPVSILWGGRIA